MDERKRKMFGAGRAGGHTSVSRRRERYSPQQIGDRLHYTEVLLSQGA